MTLYVSPTQSLTGATRIESVTRSLKLKAGAAKVLKLKIPAFPSVPDGSYFLIAAVQAPDGTTTGVAGPSLTIAAPFVAVKVSDVRPAAAPAAAGRKTALTLTLTNSGNAPASGTRR